jgi:hypothetical protein
MLTRRWPARPAPASSATVHLGQMCRCGHTGRPRRPAIPAARLPAHCHAPRAFRSDTADAGRHGHRTATPDAGGRTLDTWTLRDPHRTPDTDQLDSHPWDTGRSHRTPTRTGDDSTAGVRTSWASSPSDRILGRQPSSCSRTTRQLLARSVRQAAPRRTAVLGRLRVERRAAGSGSSVMASRSAECWERQ